MNGWKKLWLWERPCGKKQNGGVDSQEKTPMKSTNGYARKAGDRLNPTLSRPSP